MTTMTTRELGDYGERLATRYLTDQGMHVLDRNWRCGRGELDIVAVEGDDLVVCEVKTRTTTAFGAPFEAVGWQKLRRLRRLAGLWIEQRSGLVEWPPGVLPTNAVRIDVVSVLRPVEGVATVDHLRGVE